MTHGDVRRAVSVFHRPIPAKPVAVKAAMEVPDAESLAPVGVCPVHKAIFVLPGSARAFVLGLRLLTRMEMVTGMAPDCVTSNAFVAIVAVYWLCLTPVSVLGVLVIHHVVVVKLLSDASVIHHLGRLQLLNAEQSLQLPANQSKAKIVAVQQPPIRINHV